VKDAELLDLWRRGAGRHDEIPIVDTLRAIAAAAAAEEREACALEWDEDALRLTIRATRAAEIGKRMLSNRLNGEARRARSVAESIRSRTPANGGERG